MKKSVIWLGGAILAALLFVGAFFLYRHLSETYAPDTLAENPTDETGAETYKAPDFTVSDQEGNTVQLSDYFGKPIVLNFWASWCPPCKAELPAFHTVHEQLGDDVVFLMINATDGMRETKEKAKELIDEEGYTFPVYYDTELEASYVYGVSSLPATVFIDKDGNIVTAAVGQIDESALLQGISMIYTPEQEP